MSRCSSLYQALAKASVSSSGFSRNRREILLYSGSSRNARSLVSIVGLRLSFGSAGPGIVGSASFATHCFAPAGLSVSSHSWPKRISKKLLSHLLGVGVHVTSRPLVIASAPFPLAYSLFQPSPCASIGAA